MELRYTKCRNLLGDKHPAGCSPRGDKATHKSSFTTCLVTGAYQYINTMMQTDKAQPYDYLLRPTNQFI